MLLDRREWPRWTRAAAPAHADPSWDKGGSIPLRRPARRTLPDPLCTQGLPTTRPTRPARRCDSASGRCYEGDFRRRQQRSRLRARTASATRPARVEGQGYLGTSLNRISWPPATFLARYKALADRFGQIGIRDHAQGPLPPAATAGRRPKMRRAATCAPVSNVRGKPQRHRPEITNERQTFSGCRTPDVLLQGKT